MRSYTGYLLLQNLFDNLPTVSSTFTTFAHSIFNPTVTVIEAACNTTLGRILNIDYSLEGLYELAGDTLLTQTVLNSLLSQNIYTVAVRELSSCVSIAGICQACYQSSFPDQTLPVIGARVSIPSRFLFNYDIFKGNGIINTYTLTQAPANYTVALVFLNGILQSPSTYTITNKSLALTSTPPLGSDILVKYYLISAQPFFSYLAQGYAGSILGVLPLPTEPIILRPSLIKSLISPGQLSQLKNVLSTFPAVDPLYLAYVDKITDSLEKALYMICLYGLFSSINMVV